MSAIDNTRPVVATEVRVYRDGWVASRPWTADLVFSDGNVWRKWQYGFVTLKGIKNAVSHLTPAPIKRRKDMDA